MGGAIPARPAPKKSLGQHFLTNPQICRRIVDLLEPRHNDNIVEIGPGPGCLTKELLEIPHGRLLVIEKDNHWAKIWAEAKNLTVWQGDALQFAWQSLAENMPWKLVGNLPYNIASPLIWNLMEYVSLWSRAVFMTQKEVALRICANPGSKQYGALSVWVQCHANARLQFSLGPGAFQPPPKVDSSVILLEPLAKTPEFPLELAEILHIAFQQRRKKISTIFKNSGNPLLLDALAKYPVGDLRPEHLNCGEFMEIAEFMARAKKSS